MFELPRLPKYSIEEVSVFPPAVSAVSLAGRLMPQFIAVVGSPAVWLALITTGCRPVTVSRALTGIVPSASAAQPSSTSPESVRSTPSLSVWNDPVEVIVSGWSPSPFASAEVLATGRKPRPEIAISIAFDVPISEPRWSIRRPEEARTPPAE